MAMTEALPYVLIRILLVFCVGLTLVTAVFNALRHLIASKKRVVNRSRVKMQAASYFITKANANRVRRASMRWLRRVSEKRSVRETTKDLKKSSDPREINDKTIRDELGTVFQEEPDPENSLRICDDLSQSIDIVSV
ncbi:uncharacterized protein LOC134822496 [Bolinopsis microptera]|uniref:uncharacterized protein LOC134822496 n=1 Tax=Bolinopsis microptera TaxID=2820187 RepID=UPI0030794201